MKNNGQEMTTQVNSRPKFLSTFTWILSLKTKRIKNGNRNKIMKQFFPTSSITINLKHTHIHKRTIGPNKGG